MFERGFTWKNALIALGAASLFVLGMAIIVYVVIARDRIEPTPTPTATRPVTQAQPSPTMQITAVTETAVPFDTVVGVVRDYSPGALIIVITPSEGVADQIIVPENIEVVWTTGQRASPREITPGQVIYAEGDLDALGRLVAERIVIMQKAPALTATTAPSPTETLTPAVPKQAWLGEYFANKSLAGQPVLTRYDEGIDFQWQQGSPAPEVPADNFSVRWRGRWPLEQGSYVFNAYSDDGVRVWVNGVLVIDQWRDQSPTLASGEINLTTAEHTIQVEYYENGYEAEIRFWWEAKGAFPNWKGEYYANPRLEGVPALTRNDYNVSFDWGAEAPAPGLPADQFSVRWTRSILVEEGAYRFKARADDGVRVWVDGRLLLDEWHTNQQTTYEGYAWLDASPHEVRIEYYEASGSASIYVWWERIGFFAQWRGEYFANRTLSPPPHFVRNDKEILFDWQKGSAGFGLPADEFSVRWTRPILFEAGEYLFWALADDGIRVYVGGTLVIDAWGDSSLARHEGVITLAAGEHRVVVEYYEHSGDAFAQVAWELLPAVTPTPSRTASPTVTQTPSVQPATLTPTVTTAPPTPTATATPTATQTPAPTMTPTPTETPSPTLEATPTETPTTSG